MAARNEINTRIPLYARRTLGEKINAAIDFLRQNWRVALRFSIYLLLPLALIHSVGLFSFFRSLTNHTYNSVDSGFILSAIISVVSLILVYTLILTLFQYYHGSDDGELSMLTFKDVKGQMWFNFKKVLVIVLVILVFVVPISILMLVLMFVPFFSMIVFVGYAIIVFILMMAPIHYVFENINVLGAFGRSFSHARESWGKLFGLMFALLLVAGIIESVAALPMMVFVFTSDTLTPSNGVNPAITMTLDIILYVFLILETFFTYLSMTLVVTTLVFHYGSNTRELDDLAIASDIENFANL